MTSREVLCPQCANRCALVPQVSREVEKAFSKLQREGFVESPKFPSPAEVTERFLANYEPSRLASLRAYRAYGRALQICAEDGFDHLRCLDRIDIVPHDYQQDSALRILREFRGRALLADEVGLGKTIEAALVAREYDIRGLARSMLVIVPPALRVQWKDEFQRFRMGFEIIETGRDLAKLERPPRRHIISHGLFSKRTAAHFSESWDLVIVDEAHSFRRLQNVRSKVLANIRSRYLMFLTATPVQTDIADIFNLLSLLRPGFMGDDLKHFRRMFGAISSSPSSLRDRLREVMIRNRRRECLVQFPDREPHSLHVQLQRDELAAYEDLVAQCRRLGASRGLVTTSYLRMFCSSFKALANSLSTTKSGLRIDSRLLRGLQQGIHFKTRALLKSVLPMIKGRKALIFAQYKETQRELLEVLQEQGYPVTTICNTSGVARTKRILEFKNSDSLQLMICNRSASEGLNLQFCSILVNYDLPWNPMQIEQRIGRVQRLGSLAKRVQVFNLFAQGTIEDFLFEVLDRRLHMFSESVGMIEQVLGRLDKGDDFEAIVRKAIFMTDFESYAKEVGNELADLKSKADADEKKTASVLDNMDLGTVADAEARRKRLRGRAL